MKRHFQTIDTQTLAGGRSRRSQFGEPKESEENQIIFFSARDKHARSCFHFLGNCHPSDRQNQSVAFFASVYKQIHSDRKLWPLHRHNNNNEADCWLSLGGGAVYRFLGGTSLRFWLGWMGRAAMPAIDSPRQRIQYRCWWPLTYRRDGLDIYGWVRLDVAHTFLIRSHWKWTHIYTARSLHSLYTRCIWIVSMSAILAGRPSAAARKKGNNCNQHTSLGPHWCSFALI